MAGNKTIGENYSFSGVHHIFDQHKAAGRFYDIGMKLWNSQDFNDYYFG